VSSRAFLLGEVYADNMPEGVAVGGGEVIAEPTFDDRSNEPAPDPVNAPRGWLWDRGERRWRPKKAAGRGGNAAAEVKAEPDSAAAAGKPQRDPDPAWMTADEKPAEKRRRSIDDVPRAVVDDIAGFGGLIGAPLLAMLQQADPYCGTILAQSYEGIVDAVLPLVCRSEKIVAYFSGDKSDWLLWGKLAMACAPVARAVIEHHVTRTVEVVMDAGGVPHAVPRARGGGSGGDHLVPPVAEPFEYAA
jgi:hypothetical protein